MSLSFQIGGQDCILLFLEFFLHLKERGILISSIFYLSSLDTLPNAKLPTWHPLQGYFQLPPHQPSRERLIHPPSWCNPFTKEDAHIPCHPHIAESASFTRTTESSNRNKISIKRKCVLSRSRAGRARHCVPQGFRGGVGYR